VYEVEFLSSTSDTQSETRKYDAIVIRFQEEGDPRPYIVVIDAGYSDIGQVVVDHINQHYGTNRVDLLISTHADQDHINGIPTILERMEVGEVLIHQPRLHTDNAADFSNIEAVDTILNLCQQNSIKCDEEPFAGVERFDGRIVVLGPNIALYEDMLQTHLDEVRTNAFPASANSSRPTLESVLAALSGLQNRVLDLLPIEILGNSGKTGPRNNSSVITAVNIAGHRMLFTGDAGIPALEMAADEYEYRFGLFSANPLGFFQAPHHGSKRNLGTDILDRMLGPKGAGHNANLVVFITTAYKSTKHPSARVTNAVMRRGCQPHKLGVTKARQGYIRHHYNAPTRANMVPLTPHPILSEDE